MWQGNILWRRIALFVCVLLLLLLPEIYFTLAHDGVGSVYLLQGIIYIIPLSLLVLFTPSLFLQIICLTCIFFVTLIEVSTVYTYYNYIHAACFPAFLYANSGEMSDMSYYIIHKIAKHEVLPLLLYGVALTIVVTDRKFNKENRVSKGICAAVCVFVIITTYTLSDHICLHSPFHFVREFMAAMQMEQEQKHLLSRSGNFVYNATCTSDKPIVCVLAIGESLNYDHCSLNGKYARQTMPQLEQIDNLILFSDYYANATYTQQAVPMLLTRATPTDFTRCYTEHSIVSAFKEAGFKTFVLSHKNQIMNNGVHHYLADDADSVIFVDSDSGVVNALADVSNSGGKVFVLMHFLGNHFFYSNYPECYNIWKPNYTYNKDVESDSLFINAYDNSILYVDSLLAASIYHLQDELSAFMFISDHGEYLDRHIGGHGLSINPTEQEYHVPLMIWTSARYKETYPDKIKNIHKHQNTPICADHVFWSVLDAAEVSINNELMQNGLSVFGDTLLPHERDLVLPNYTEYKEL